jgi:hypothetical protein
VGGGTVIGLDLSGHVGYVDNWTSSFTDSSGFAFGTGETKFTDLGARARFFGILPDRGFAWMPFVSGTVDQRVGFSNTVNLPSQPTLIGGDTLSMGTANTFVGTELGRDILAGGGWVIGAKGFYTASADTNIAGGSAYLRIPLTYLPFVAQRY